MALQLTKQLNSALNRYIQLGFLAPTINHHNFDNVRNSKHWNPKFKRLRKMKFIKIELPEFNVNQSSLTKEEIRSKMKEKGILPPRSWMERPVFVSSTGSVFEGYVPPEGDGKVSLITAQGAKQNIQKLEKKTKSMMAIRKIRSFDEDFDTADFCKFAEEIYKKSHECIASKDKYQLREYVTERAYPEVIHNIFNKTIRWKFIKNIEPARVVHARCTDIITKDNIFAQLTVRFHTQQALSIYDRFGRLMHGSDIIAKDVLEYVVFEKHLANEYGTWKIHAKIIPDWMPPKEPSILTYRKPLPPTEEKKSDEQKQEIEQKTITSSKLPEDNLSNAPTTKEL